MLDKSKCAMMRGTDDPEVRATDAQVLALVKATRDYLVFVLRWLERRYGLVK